MFVLMSIYLKHLISEWLYWQCTAEGLEVCGACVLLAEQITSLLGTVLFSVLSSLCKQMHDPPRSLKESVNRLFSKWRTKLSSCANCRVFHTLPLWMSFMYFKHRIKKVARLNSKQPSYCSTLLYHQNLSFPTNCHHFMMNENVITVTMWLCSSCHWN